MDQLIETEMNIFLGRRYNAYYPIHMPSMMITFVQLFYFFSFCLFLQYLLNIIQVQVFSSLNILRVKKG